MKTVKGNLIDLAEAGEFDIIVHGCNCFNLMGGGIAREIRARYPGAYEADCQTTAGDREKLGTYTRFNTGEFIIVNAYTQFQISRGDDVFEYEAFLKILQTLSTQYPGKRFGFPMIGAGLAGGDWAKIHEMIRIFHDAIENFGGSATVVQFDGT